MNGEKRRGAAFTGEPQVDESLRRPTARKGESGHDGSKLKT
jgi:hypothetical protein